MSDRGSSEPDPRRGSQRRLPPLNALRAFEAAARYRNFTRAAEELNVTQAAVSHQVKLLEGYLGDLLFIRQANGLVPTETGEIYFNVLSQAFDLLSDATKEIVDHAAESGLVIDSHPNFAMRWLVPRLRRLRDEHPALTVNLRVSSPTGECDFARQKIDVAIRYGTEWPGLLSHYLFTPVMFPVCSPATLERHGGALAIRDLLDETFMVVASEPDDWRRWFECIGMSPPATVKQVAFDSYALALQAVIEGEGVAMGRLPLVVEDVAAGRLIAPFSAAIEAEKSWYLIYTKSAALKPRVRTFVRWIIAEAKVSAADIAVRKREFRIASPGEATPAG